MEDTNNPVVDKWKRVYPRLKRLINYCFVFSILMIVAAFIIAAATNGWQLQMNSKVIMDDFKGKMKSFTFAAFLLIFGVFLLVTSIQLRSRIASTNQEIEGGGKYGQPERSD